MWKRCLCFSAELLEGPAELEAGEQLEGFLLPLLASDDISQEEMYANISELMLGAVETVSLRPFLHYTVFWPG